MARATLRLALAALALLSSTLFAIVSGAETLTFDTNPAPDVKPVKITASLYLPASPRPAPAMVIISSSGGVLDWIEGYYARELAREGVAALVVDSFRPRGVSKIISDQSLVTSWDMENDAFAALAVLKKDPRIDGAHIGVMGLSKGGLVAQNAAFLARRKWRRTGDLSFAAHVAIAPDCVAQHRNPETTNRPLFYMLAEADDADPAAACADYAKRITAAGNAKVELKIYKGAHHNWEWIGGVHFLETAENFSKCPAVIEDSGAWVMAGGAGPVAKGSAEVFAWRRAHCRILGYHVGGGTVALKQEATRDLIAFLRRQGF